MEEVNVAPQNSRFVITGVGGTGTENTDQYQHEVFKITLKNIDEAYALDLSNTQEGCYKPGTPWEEYVEVRVASPYLGKCFHYLGGYRDYTESRLDAHDLSDETASFASLNLKMYKALKRMTMNWGQKNDTTVATFLQLKPDDFEKKSKEIVITFQRAYRDTKVYFC